MNEHTLEEVEVEKDLGVIMDKDLKFHKHASFAIKKANTILGLIKRYFAVLDHKTLLKLFKAMVRLHLKYGNVVWGPHFKLDQQAIERVQKRATKLIHNIKDLPYSERLDHLKLFFSNSELQLREDTSIKFISNEQQNFREYKVFRIEL